MEYQFIAVFQLEDKILADSPHTGNLSPDNSLCELPHRRKANNIRSAYYYCADSPANHDLCQFASYRLDFRKFRH